MNEELQNLQQDGLEENPLGPETQGSDGAQDDREPTLPCAGGQAAAFLDSITEGGSDESQAPVRSRDELGRFASSDPMRPPDGGQAQPGQHRVEQPPQSLSVPKTPEQEEADLLEGIKSERGRARVAQIMEERKNAQGEVAAVRDLVQAAGMTAESFGQHIEFSRLANSNDPRDVQQAVQMLEQTRSALYQRLGQDAPGVDALADFPDLAQRVQNLEMPRETALEVAKMRRDQQVIQAQQWRQQQAQQETVQFQRSVAQAQQSLEGYIQTRAHEIDHPSRMKALQAYFADPRKLQEFAGTYQPHQWPAAIRMLYDNMQAAGPVRRAPPAPISGRTGALGRPVPTADQPSADRIMAHIDSLGL